MNDVKTCLDALTQRDKAIGRRHQLGLAGLAQPRVRNCLRADIDRDGQLAILNLSVNLAHNNLLLFGAEVLPDALRVAQRIE